VAHRGQYFENMSIRNKILLGYGALIVPFAVVIAMFWAVINKTEQEVYLVQDDTLPFMKAVEKVRLAGLRLAMESGNYGTLSILDSGTLATPPPLEPRRPEAPTTIAPGEEGGPRLSLFMGERDEMLSARGTLAAASRELQPFLNGSGNGAELYRDKLTAAVAALESISRRIEEIVAQTPSREAIVEAVETLNGAENEFIAITASALAAEDAEQTEASGELASTLSTSRSIVTILGLLGTLATVGGGLFIAGRIANPIRRLSEQARLVGLGEFNALDRETTGGEVGTLAGAIGTMVDNLRAMIDKMGRQQKLSALGQLAGTVGHDLRNPLAAMGATLHTLRQTSQSKGFGIERALDRMGRSVERCNAIVADLLDYTRTPDLRREATSLDGWLGDLLDEHKLASGVALQRELASDVEALIDRDRFRRVIINLIDNAAQAMTVQGWTPPDDRVPTVSVRAEAAGPHIRLAVADNGPGISSESLAKIFEPLFTTKSSGVGLGLPIVRQIIEQHGGTIDVESLVDVGTTFTIFLPRQAGAHHSAPAVAPEHAAA
jgi:signal transduction histidine kinase